MKIPRLNKIAGMYKGLRTEYNEIWIMSDYIVASNNYMLVWYDTKDNNFFLPEYFDSIDFDGDAMLVHYKDWAKIANKEVYTFYASETDKTIDIKTTKGDRIVIDFAFMSENMLPEWKPTLPIDLDNDGVDVIEPKPNVLTTLNINYLNAIKDALPSENGHRIKMYGENKPILIETDEYPITKAGAVLMPIMKFY